MRNGSQEGMLIYHHGLGTWIRNEWGLWGGSRLRRYFREKGLFHPDDMSGIILESFWYKLHGQPYDLGAAILTAQAYWESIRNDTYPLEQDSIRR